MLYFYKILGLLLRKMRPFFIREIFYLLWALGLGLEPALMSPDDPSPGELSCGIELNNYPKIVAKNGFKKCGRTGPWNGIGFSGALGLKANQIYDFNFVSNNDEVYIMYHTIKNSAITRAVLNQTSYLYESDIWVEADKKMDHV